jgi:hypothetical protein
MSLAVLAGHLAGCPDLRDRWRLIAEFLEEFRWEATTDRRRLVAEEPPPTGEEQWDAFLAALAEHLMARDGRGAPRWAHERALDRFGFPVDTRAARVDALVHSPASFRKRGIFIAPQELEVA